MELQRALAQIGDIRLQMERTRLFRGYTAPATLTTAFIAIVAAISQSAYIGNSADSPFRFVQFWMGAAFLCIALCGIEVARRFQRSDSSLQRELTLSAIEQLVPCLLVAACLTAVLYFAAPTSLWLLLGLWQIFFGLGIANSRKLLPQAVVFVGIFYLLCGFMNLAGGPSATAFSAWRMGIPFAIGQAASALLLRRQKEEDHAA